MTLIRVTAVLIVSLCVWFTAGAQKIVTMKLDGKHDLLIQEVGAVIHFSGDTLQVADVMQGFSRSSRNKEADLKQGDIIMMANGSRPAGVAGLRKLYDGLAVGGELKLGVKRGGTPVIVTIIREDQSSQPGRKMMRMTVDDKDMKLLPGIGTVDEKNGTIVLAGMPPNEEVAKASPLKVGDVIKTINGTPAASFSQADAIYEKIKPGEKVALSVIRNGEEMKLTVTKPQGMRRVIINK